MYISKDEKVAIASETTICMIAAILDDQSRVLGAEQKVAAITDALKALADVVNHASK